jgi:hypothetical protein
MSAPARKIHSAEFEQVTLETPEPVRPALQVVADPAARATASPSAGGWTRWSGAWFRSGSRATEASPLRGALLGALIAVPGQQNGPRHPQR